VGLDLPKKRTDLKLSVIEIRGIRRQPHDLLRKTSEISLTNSRQSVHVHRARLQSLQGQLAPLLCGASITHWLVTAGRIPRSHGLRRRRAVNAAAAGLLGWSLSVQRAPNMSGRRRDLDDDAGEEAAPIPLPEVDEVGFKDGVASSNSCSKASARHMLILPIPLATLQCRRQVRHESQLRRSHL